MKVDNRSLRALRRETAADMYRYDLSDDDDHYELQSLMMVTSYLTPHFSPYFTPYELHSLLDFLRT